MRSEKSRFPKIAILPLPFEILLQHEAAKAKRLTEKPPQPAAARSRSPSSTLGVQEQSSKPKAAALAEGRCIHESDQEGSGRMKLMFHQTRRRPAVR